MMMMMMMMIIMMTNFDDATMMMMVVVKLRSGAMAVLVGANCFWQIYISEYTMGTLISEYTMETFQAWEVS